MSNNDISNIISTHLNDATQLYMEKFKNDRQSDSAIESFARTKDEIHVLWDSIKVDDMKTARVQIVRLSAAVLRTAVELNTIFK